MSNQSGFSRNPKPPTLAGGAITKKIGFNTATTTRHGNVYKEHKDYLECLPRVMLTVNINI